MPTGLDPALEFHIANSLGWNDLRPLQREAVAPVMRGDDCLLLAPTAGGKTEAAAFPLLSRMATEQWQGLSVLYVTPLRALLNNLQPRLDSYANWIGRRVRLWHGDVGPGERKRLIADMPDILLTTPESLEAMLVSTHVDHRFVFANLHTIVIDEMHAFAGDDRGWHLLAVLERLQVLAGRRIQRIGLSATVGNPDELLTWMEGGTPAVRASIINPAGASDGPVVPVNAEVTLDYVGSVINAATVVSKLHGGEKRLVFCESRAQAEKMAAGLRENNILTFVSHSSLSREERHRSEQAFAEARDCVVVATSTLELGIDVGDLDRVIQIDSPRTVASFLQRLGRTGRRAGTERNTTFLTTRDDSLLQAAGLLRLWREGFVEAVVPPAQPRHIAAQQLLALALQEGALGFTSWRSWWSELSFMNDAQPILDYLVSAGFLAVDGANAFVGDAAETAFGRRNFMDLTAVFTADPELRVVVGRQEIGSIPPLALSRGDDGSPAVLLLGGRRWQVTNVDWRARVVAVVEAKRGGRSQWTSLGLGSGLSARLAGSIRDVLLGEDPDVDISRRAAAQLVAVRSDKGSSVDPDGIVLQRTPTGTAVWTFAGDNANTSLAAALEANGIEAHSESLAVFSPNDLTVTRLRDCATALTSATPPAPAVTPTLLEGLKFSTALPVELAMETIVARITAPAVAAEIAKSPAVDAS